ncbi:MAG: TAXI family TRAP transporter solute-binding subunit [Pseudomonadota bacterium]
MSGQTDQTDVNLKSRRSSQTWRFAIYALLVILVSAIVGSLWLNRDREPMLLTVATGPMGSDAFVLMREVAEVVERHSPTLRLEVRATQDASQNIALLNQGEIDTAVIRSDTPVVSNVRVIADMYPDVMHLITRAAAGIRTVNDMARASISIPPFGTDAFRSFWVLGDHYDLPIDRMNWDAEAFTKGVERLLDGDVDALFATRSLRDAQLIRLFEDAQLKRLRLRLVPIRQAAAIAVKRPFLEPAIIPEGTYTGATPVPDIDLPTPSVDRILVSREDISADAIRELTRILFEHRLDLTIRFSLASAITQPDQSRGLSVPLHDGAEAFYQRDEPSFIQENAEPLALMVTVATLLISSLFALRSRLSAGQKNRADIYNYQILDIQKRALLEDDIEELHGLKVELADVLQTVVVALDTDDVSDEGFHSFSILLEAVRETINDRISQLR